MAAPRGDDDEQDRRVRGAEVFVGGLPRSATEGTLREIFSSCGEIVDVRIMKSQNGNPKGYAFVRFSKREYAVIARRQKNGIELQGKRLCVDLSLDQDTLFFGNLKKEWSLEEFEELIRKSLNDVVSVDLAMASNPGSSRKRHLNRGFGFVRFSSHAAAARVLRIGSRTDFLLGGILHPSINWAEKESHVDDEMAEIKTAFVGNLPKNVNEKYLKRLFEQFGEVMRVNISRKGQYPVGFVHFSNRHELDSAIEEMDGKTVRGPDQGPNFRIQVSVSRHVVENNKKRTREEVKTRSSNSSRDRPDRSYVRYRHDSRDRQIKSPRLSDDGADISDPYELAINSLPSAVKELLLRILRLGIGTRYDIDMHCVKSLNDLPESSAVGVLNQFLISGGDKRDKGEYFASLIAKRQAETFGLARPLHGNTYLPRNPNIQSNHFRHEDYDYMAARSSRYSPSGHYPSPYYIDDDPPVPETRNRRYAEERPTVEKYLEPRSRQEEISSIGRYPESRLAHEPKHDTGKYLDQRYIREQSPKFDRSEETVLPRERRLVSAAGYKTDVSSEFHHSRSSAEYTAERQQLRFDPFTGAPYKFDPFTGEPIRPESNQRHPGSLY